MNIWKKIEDDITGLEAEAARCLKLAAEMREALKRASINGSEKPLLVQPRAQQRKLELHHKGEQKSVRTLALELIKSNDKALHVDDLVMLINAKRHDPTNRAAVESQLTRALQKGKFGIKRTAPGTFGVA